VIRVVVAEDQALLATMIGQAISRDGEIKVVAVARDGAEAVECCARHLPDVTLMDMRMPGMGGLDAAAVIRERFPGIRIIILTSFQTDDEVSRALGIGVNAFLMKDVLPEDLVAALRQVHRGMYVLHAEAYRRVCASFRQKVVASVPPRHDSPAVDLSAQEVEVVKCIVRGMSNKEIAVHVAKSEGTVRNCISRILARTGLQDRTQLAVYAIREDLG
jgi:DNA-binding NarL/FixJ family response regulator